ncbi:hypothetical protein BsWGS_21830 [Bradybaena similaris]
MHDGHDNRNKPRRLAIKLMPLLPYESFGVSMHVCHKNRNKPRRLAIKQIYLLAFESFGVGKYDYHDKRNKPRWLAIKLTHLLPYESSGEHTHECSFCLTAPCGRAAKTNFHHSVSRLGFTCLCFCSTIFFTCPCAQSSFSYLSFFPSFFLVFTS